MCWFPVTSKIYFHVSSHPWSISYERGHGRGCYRTSFLSSCKVRIAPLMQIMIIYLLNIHAAKGIGLRHEKRLKKYHSLFLIVSKELQTKLLF